MMKFIVAAAVVLLAACAPAAHGDTPSARSYIAAAGLDPQSFLPPPPAPGSSAQAADLAEVKAEQALIGKPRWAQARSDHGRSPYRAFAPVLGPGFTQARTPMTAALFKVLFADVKSLTRPAKRAYSRPRPPKVDGSLRTCRMLEFSKSYPSGHATRGELMGLVLADMVPERADALRARGRDYGDSRVVCAQHFPTDVAAGRILAAKVYEAAKANPAFARDFAIARTELRAALGY